MKEEKGVLKQEDLFEHKKITSSRPFSSSYSCVPD